MSIILMIVFVAIGFTAGVKAQQIRHRNIEIQAFENLGLIDKLREVNARQTNRIRDYQKKVEELNRENDDLTLQLSIANDSDTSEPEYETLCDGFGTAIKQIRVDVDPICIAPNLLYDENDSWKIKPSHERTWGAITTAPQARPASPRQPWPGLFVVIMNMWLGLKNAFHFFLFGRVTAELVKKGVPNYARIAELENDRYIRTTAEQISELVDRDEWAPDRSPV